MRVICGSGMPLTVCSMIAEWNGMEWNAISQRNEQYTALHIAARYGYANIVGLLLDAGAGPDARDKVRIG